MCLDGSTRTDYIKVYTYILNEQNKYNYVGVRYRVGTPPWGCMGLSVYKKG